MDILTSTPATPLGVAEPTLPFRFRVPAGWPTPSPDWLAANQAWEPPVGWTPAEGLPAAPDAWLFWERQENGWARFASVLRRQHLRGVAIDLVLLAGGVLLLGIQDSEHGLTRMLLWGVMLFAPIDLACHLAHLLRMPSTIVDIARATSACIGPELDATAYVERGRPDHAAFVADRRREAWSETAGWPSDQNHRTQFTPRQSTLSLRRRLATMGLAGTLGALLILVLAWSTSGLPLVAR